MLPVIRRIGLCEALEPRFLMAFGLTTSTNLYTVDTGAQVVFSVSRTTASSAAVGDLTSVTYNGTQLEAPFSATSRYSHYESGLGSSAIVTPTIDPNGNWIMITCDDTAGTGVIQYYIARKGFNNVYMATYAPGPDSPAPGEMRFIMYTNHSILTNAPTASNLTGNTGAIESSDVFGFADGTSASKYYGEIRSIDETYHGLTGGGFGMFMNMGNRESSSGGPFMKDIDFQTTSSQSTELYNYMFSGHSQTENFRPGLQGPYALQVTNGGAPAAIDYSFIDGLNLTGEVPASGRGSVSGVAGAVTAGLQETVALSNAAAQYWTTPDGATGSYTIAGVKPGTYTETLYQGELAVGTGTMAVSAGATTAANISDSLYTPPAVFRIGTWDGTPIGFLNADKIQNMHPSDSRMTPWVNTTFTVGTDADSTWPMAQWQDASLNSTNTISFNLTAAQAAIAMTLRIGITRSGAGGRPIISVNGGKFSNPIAAPNEPTARGVTVGNWRGNNVLITYGISTSALHAGTNTIAINVASGSSSTSPYLSPWVIYDAIDLVTNANLTQTLTSVSAAPTPVSVADGETAQLTATARDQNGTPLVTQPVFTWSIDSGGVGTVSSTGLYTAPASGPGSATVRAKTGTISGTSAVTVILSQINGTSGADNIRLVRSGTLFNVFIGSTLTYSVPFSTLGAVTVSGGAGDDVVTVDFSGGASPIPAAGLTVDGSGGSNDELAIAGTASGDSVGVSTTSVTVDGGVVQLVNDELIALASVNSQPIVLGSLSVSAGAMLKVSPGSSSVLTLSNVPTLAGTLDLQSSQLTVSGAGAAGLASITAYLKSGFNAGAGYWNGTVGIVSGIAASDPTFLQTLGVNLSSNNVIVKLTHYGDADLNGTLNGADYQQIDLGFGANLTGWSNGDFNYDGKVNGSDFALIDNAFNQQTAVSAAAIVADVDVVWRAGTVRATAMGVFNDQQVIVPEWAGRLKLSADGALDYLFTRN